MSRNVVIGAVVVLVVVVAWYYLQSQKGGYIQTQTPPQPAAEETPAATSEAAPSATTEENIVTITSSGFSPQNITITVGESVTWVNEDTENHQIQSAVHPTHQLYPPFNTVGLLKSGEKKSLSFPESGTYKYHDHLNPSFTASVTVE